MHTMLCPALRGRMTSGVTTASSSWGSAIPPSRTWTRAVRWPTRCGRRWRRAAPPAVRGAAGRQQMSLSRSFRESPPPGDVSRAALEALRAPECSDGSRCALLQVYAVLGDAAALPDALAPPSPGFGRRRTPTREKHLRLSPKSANSGYCSASAPDIIHRQKE